MQISLLKSLGFSDKNATVYLTLLRLGPSSVRKLAELSELNRGVVYEGLKWLQEKGVVEFYEKDSKQYFVARDPERLLDVVKDQTSELREVEKKLSAVIPELKALHHRGGD